MPTYLRYAGASAGALGIDMALFLAALTSGLLPTLAAALGYCSGIIAHWLLSSRLVFHDNLAAVGGARSGQQALFGLSALAGLACTMAIVALGDGLGLDARVAKIIAIALSFQLTYVLRRRVVFAGG